MKRCTTVLLASQKVKLCLVLLSILQVCNLQSYMCAWRSIPMRTRGSKRSEIVRCNTVHGIMCYDHSNAHLHTNNCIHFQTHTYIQGSASGNPHATLQAKCTGQILSYAKFHGSRLRRRQMCFFLRKDKCIFLQEKRFLTQQQKMTRGNVNSGKQPQNSGLQPLPLLQP